MIFQADERIGGLPRYFVSKARESLVRIPDEIGKCVAFVYYRKAMADPPKPGGTVFFVAMANAGERAGAAYAVTAKHAIEECCARSQDGKILLRTHVKGAGLDFIETKPKDWFYHPTDETVDVAVLPLQADEEESARSVSVLKALDIKLYGPLPKGTASPAVIAEEGIGAGDEVFIIGLFSNHPGELQNIPIARIGNIAAMPGELVRTKWQNRAIEAYLIEARSIGGLSGSPVFVHLGPIRMAKSQYAYTPGVNVQFAAHRSGPHYLLGLVHGHFDLSLLDIAPDFGVGTEDAAKQVQINCGIAIVVPVSKILEVLNQPALIEDRRLLNEAVTREGAASPD